MGCFSWITSDTNRSISSYDSCKGAFPVYLLCPNGLKIKEENYEGYGIFGGRDAYALVATWNIPEQCKDEEGNFKPDEKIRHLGISIACYDDENASLKYPLKFVENGDLNYNDVDPSKGCPDQGLFYCCNECNLECDEREDDYGD